MTNPKVDEVDGIKCGPVKTYTHEKFYIKDSQGRICKIRCSFDEDNFILRSVSLIETSNSTGEGFGLDGATFGKYIPIKKVIMDDKAKFEEINE